MKTGFPSHRKQRGTIRVLATSPLVKDLAINYLVDTGPLVALLDADDKWRQWGKVALTTLDTSLNTTEMVITES